MIPHGKARLGMAWLGLARRGWAGLGAARQGSNTGAA